MNPPKTTTQSPCGRAPQPCDQDFSSRPQIESGNSILGKNDDARRRSLSEITLQVFVTSSECRNSST
jgi:hypothetical protein